MKWLDVDHNFPNGGWPPRRAIVFCEGLLIKTPVLFQDKTPNQGGFIRDGGRNQKVGLFGGASPPWSQHGAGRSGRRSRRPPGPVLAPAAVIEPLPPRRRLAWPKCPGQALMQGYKPMRGPRKAFCMSWASHPQSSMAAMTLSFSCMRRGAKPWATA